MAFKINYKLGKIEEVDGEGNEMDYDDNQSKWGYNNDKLQGRGLS